MIHTHQATRRLQEYLIRDLMAVHLGRGQAFHVVMSIPDQWDRTHRAAGVMGGPRAVLVRTHLSGISCCSKFRRRARQRIYERVLQYLHPRPRLVGLFAFVCRWSIVIDSRWEQGLAFHDQPKGGLAYLIH